MDTRVRRGAVALGALLAWAVPAAGQDPPARVKVRMPWLRSAGVVGEPVQGLTLRLTSLETGAAATAVTGADGGFRFDDLAPGPYRLHVTPAGGDPDRPLTIGLGRAFLPGPEATKPREIVVVGLAEPVPEGARAVPAHGPEWTDLSDHDPGVAKGEGHDAWIELASLAFTDDEKSLLVTIPPRAWRGPASGRYFDLWVGAEKTAWKRHGPIRCYGCGDVEASAVEGGIVFGDGIRGARPPPAKVAAPVRVAPPDEEP